MTNFVLQRKYDEAIAEYLTLQAKLRQMKNDYEAARYATVQQFKEAQQNAQRIKKELNESNEKLQRTAGRDY